MTTQIDSNNVQQATLAALQPVTVTSVQITDSSWTVLDDSAVSTSGGYIVITGSNFQAGCNVIINSTNATSVSFVSSTTLRVQVPAMTAGTYVVYVVNTNGGTAIIVNGLTYSGTPTWVTSSPLADGIVNVAISIQLSATGDGSITYAVAAGSSLPSGLTLTSGGLLSGTVTGISSNTTYNFTINAIDAQAQDSPKAFAITITTGDQYFDYVSTLLSASTPTTLPFNDDASTNNFAVTVNGDTRPYNLNPYTPGYYSNYFDGTGDYLSIADNTAFDYGTGSFTVEFWMYPTAAKTCQIYDHANSPASGVAGLFVNFNTNSTVSAGQAYGSTYVTSAAVALNNWHHVAVVRNGTAWTIYVNGVSSGTGSNAVNLTATGPVTIGGNSRNTAETFQGYLSNLRVVKGTAVYTSGFTPPTTPLDNISGTSLLTCQSNRFIDNSSNTFSITRNGDTYISPFTPYVPNSSYATYGSTYFDGNGDYLNIATNSAFNLTGDFTIECWFYDNGSSLLYPTMIGNATGWSAGSFSFRYNNTGQANKISIHWNGATPADPFISSTSTFPTKTWTHVAFTRSGSTCTLWVNGTSQGTGTYATALNLTYGGMNIGWSAWDTTNGYFKGYISNVRVNNGTAIYTTAFTPSTSPLTAVSGTSLLTCQSNQPVANNAFLDKSTNDFAITRAGNTTQGTFSPYGAGYSVYFPNASYMNTQSASGAYTSIPNTTNFDLGTGDFTMEGWIFPMQLPSADTWPTNWQNHSSLFGRGTASQADGYNLVLGATKLIFQSSDTVVLSGTHNITVNNWYHVAVSRTSGTLQLFVNGVSVGSVSYTGSPGAGANFYIGCETGQGAYFYGYMSNVRLVKGTGLYTTTFTPSSTPLQPVAGTQLLTNQSQSFIDNSPNFGAVTATNSPSVQRLSPFSGTTLPTQYYSNYFDGTGDYLSFTPNSSFAFGTGDFTVECWYYPTSAVTSEYLIDNRNASQLVTWVFTYNWTGSNSGTLYWYNGSSALAQASGSTTTNAWNHIVYVRSGTTGSMYINGTRVATQTDNTNYSNTPLSSTIGNRYTNTGSDQYVKGYLSNFRVVNGTAVYDPTQSTITVPTSPLTAVANTKLLTCQSNTFVDNSTNNFTITANGDTKPRAISPFTLTYSTSQSYSQSVIGGSMYFDGTGDYLSSSNSAFAMGTGSFTWEAWIYNTGNTGAYRQIFSTRTAATSSTTAGSLALQTNTNYLVWYTSVAVITTSVAVPLNAWSHVAMVRNGTAMTLYLNGVSVGTATNSDNLTASVFTIGANNDGSEPFMGYISDVRVTKNQAIYTSAFVPSNTPLTAIKNSIYLVNGTGSGIYDSSASMSLETAADTKLSSAIAKFSGTTSMYFDGTGDYMLTSPTPNLEFGSENFTIEFWFYRVGTGRMALYSGSWGTDWSIGIDISSVSPNTSNTIGIWASSNGTSWNLINADSGGNGVGTIAVSQNTWTHIAYVRNGTTWMSFINGVVDRNITGLSGTIVNRLSAPKVIGAWFSAGAMSTANGYISDFRITKGIARYTTAFTPPTTPFIIY